MTEKPKLIAKIMADKCANICCGYLDLPVTKAEGISEFITESTPLASAWAVVLAASKLKLANHDHMADCKCEYCEIESALSNLREDVILMGYDVKEIL